MQNQPTVQPRCSLRKSSVPNGNSLHCGNVLIIGQFVVNSNAHTVHTYANTHNLKSFKSIIDQYH